MNNYSVCRAVPDKASGSAKKLWSEHATFVSSLLNVLNKENIEEIESHRQ